MTARIVASTAVCSKCGDIVTRWRDAERTIPAAYCHRCHAAYMREHRPKHSELSADQKKRSNSRSYANVYKGRGKLIPLPCESCGGFPTESHHDDYDKPLLVRWLCRSCHLEHHQSHK